MVTELISLTTLVRFVFSDINFDLQGLNLQVFLYLILSPQFGKHLLGIYVRQ